MCKTNYVQYNFSHNPMSDLQPVPEQQLRNQEITYFTYFVKLPQQTKLLERFKHPDKKGFKLMEKKGEILALWTTPTPKLSTMSTVWNISIGQLGLSVCLCSLPVPANLLVS